jgi:hypothetical protein
MCSRKNVLHVLALAASCVTFADSVAQQNTPSDDASDKSGPPSTFAQVVNQYFSQWDSNGDGTLSKDEIEAAVANPKFRDEAAAAIAAIEKVVRGNKYTLPPITRDYLVSSPLREPSTPDEQTDSADDVSKPENFDHAPAFQPRYLNAIRKLRHTSRDLFPQDLPSFDATHQGALGDCPFASTVGAMVYRDPSAVKAMFTQNDNGSITVSFGDGHSIKIAHLTDADIAIWSSAGTNGLWLTVLEKAYRRILLRTQRPNRQDNSDIYEKFNSAHTIEILDGHQTRKVELHNIRPGTPQLAALRKDLNAAQREHRLVKAGTPAGKKTPGITPGHAYAILGYDKETDLVRVWNPHGNNFTPKGPDGLQNGYTTKSGQFDIPLRDLLHIFRDVTFETQALNRQ